MKTPSSNSTGPLATAILLLLISACDGDSKGDAVDQSSSTGSSTSDGIGSSNESVGSGTSIDSTASSDTMTELPSEWSFFPLSELEAQFQQTEFNIYPEIDGNGNNIVIAEREYGGFDSLVALRFDRQTRTISDVLPLETSDGDASFSSLSHCDGNTVLMHWSQIQSDGTVKGMFGKLDLNSLSFFDLLSSDGRLDENFAVCGRDGSVFYCTEQACGHVGIGKTFMDATPFPDDSVLQVYADGVIASEKRVLLHSGDHLSVFEPAKGIRALNNLTLKSYADLLYFDFDLAGNAHIIVQIEGQLQSWILDAKDDAEPMLLGKITAHERSPAYHISAIVRDNGDASVIWMQDESPSTEWWLATRVGGAWQPAQIVSSLHPDDETYRWNSIGVESKFGKNGFAFTKYGRINYHSLVGFLSPQGLLDVVYPVKTTDGYGPRIARSFDSGAAFIASSAGLYFRVPNTRR